MPAYQFSLLLQMSNTHIGEFFSGLLWLFSTWKSMRVRGDAHTLKLNLIAAFKQKFNYELESKFYRVAALLHVSQLQNWYINPANDSYVKNADDAIEEVVFKLVRSNKEEMPTQSETQSLTKSGTSDSIQSEKAGFFKKNKQKATGNQKKSKTNELVQNIRKETAEYLNYLKSKEVEELNSTRYFWSQKASEFPNLAKAALILYNIPASSAFIERFFSICGITCRKNAGNMGPSMIINRSMLKANLNLLDMNFE
jgi:predicted DNA-binding ribbon-helix-helix protein